MILYLDSSALAKRYLMEARSAEVERVIVDAEQAGTAMISRAEVSAALAKAVRMNWVARDEAHKALADFQAQWTSLFRLHIRETTVERADGLAWKYALRGYDAVHLACAVLWQESVSSPVILATFDRPLWEAARLAGLSAWPDTLE
ncbi:MAG: type II toxin-antitoxin system VapC family toxin [Gammaproteobacteria bacterium]